MPINNSTSEHAKVAVICINIQLEFQTVMAYNGEGES